MRHYDRLPGTPYKVNEAIASLWGSGTFGIAKTRMVNEQYTNGQSGLDFDPAGLSERQELESAMREVGVVILLSVAATAAAPALPAPMHAPIVTAKSAEQFAGCFARTQDARSAAWAFVPKRGGGTFSNLGAAGVSDPYFLVISDRGEQREVRLENAAAGTTAAKGVSQCI